MAVEGKLVEAVSTRLPAHVFVNLVFSLIFESNAVVDRLAARLNAEVDLIVEWGRPPLTWFQWVILAKPILPG